MFIRMLPTLAALSILHAADSSAARDWPAYGGNPSGTRYSALKQIDRSNVSRLQLAWTYDTADGPGDSQTQPLVVNGVLFGLTPTHKVIALDAATGKLLWTFDSGLIGGGPDRGLAYWSGAAGRRILVGVQSYVYALDAATGKPVSGFGTAGRIDLREDLGRDPAKQSVVLTSPGIIYKDLLIVGGRLPEALPAPPGDIRAYDVRTGKLRWSFHTIPHPGEFGYDTWPKDAWTYSGAANNWAGIALDTQRGILFASHRFRRLRLLRRRPPGRRPLRQHPPRSARPIPASESGIFRPSTTISGIAISPLRPRLSPSTAMAKPIDAVAQTTKQGWLYLFDRATGQPLFPIENRKYARSDVPGEVTARMQPLPVKPAPFARQSLTEDMLTTRTPAGTPGRARTLPRGPQRRPVPAFHRRPRNRHLPGFRRRRRMGRLSLRSRNRPPLCQRQ